MRCPHCHSLEDKVVESRTLSSGDSIRRRRECTECGYRFTSYERIEEKQLMVIKRTGDRREPFSRQKLERGIQRALEKRPVSQVEIENIINEIEDEAVMKGRGSHEITSHEVGEMVLKKLYAADKVAYIRFASVYRNFEDVEQFIHEIETLVELTDRKVDT
ncbi:MAG TPA: transcriptional regulator NrdR [Spirochaetia bacterium]|nr:transcriptional regulator NrdR [Spirochaetia bacterium]